jgi:hypothetical protein
MNYYAMQQFATPPLVQNVGEHNFLMTSQPCERCLSSGEKCNFLGLDSPCNNCMTIGAKCRISKARKRKDNRSSRKTWLQSPTKSTYNMPVVDGIASIHELPGSTCSSVVDAGDYFRPIPTSHQRNEPFIPPFTDPPETHTNLSNLPDYIRQPQRKFKSYEIEYLSRGNALSIPNSELRDALIQAYVNLVYLTLPVVDLQELFEALDRTGSKPKISLILFQAIMFTGTAFVDLQLLLNAGFPDRMTARAHFYDKVKVSSLVAQ